MDRRRIEVIIIFGIFSFIVPSRGFNINSWVEQKEREGYDKLSPPGISSKTTTDVQIQLYVESIGNFRAATMDYDLDIYFVTWWTDSRLSHNEPEFINLNDRQLISRLWIPDIYFSNSKSATINDVTVPNCVLKIAQKGTIRYSMRVSLKLSCNMNLKGYPMDKQTCYVKIVTYGNTVERVNVTWVDQEPILLDVAIMEADLRIDREKVQAVYCDGKYFDMEFSCLRADFFLQRYLEYSLLRTYIPTVVIVAISWISFWIDPSSVPGRVGLAVTTLLTLFTQAIATHFHLPPVSYATGQDVWFGMCIMFQFFVLIEFAIVNMYTRRGDEALNKRSLSDAKVTRMLKASHEDKSPVDDGAIGLKRQQLSQRYKKTAFGIDRLSRFVFPTCFVLFSIIYWVYYLHFVDKDKS